MGVPKNGWFPLKENPIKMDDLGVPLFQETAKYGGYCFTKKPCRFLSRVCSTLRTAVGFCGRWKPWRRSWRRTATSTLISSRRRRRWIDFELGKMEETPNETPLIYVSPAWMSKRVLFELCDGTLQIVIIWYLDGTPTIKQPIGVY